MTRYPTNQGGFVLVVGLIMLAVLTLFAVTAINDTSIDLKIVGNMQAQMRVEEAVQQGIEDKISSASTFESPTSNTATYSGQSVTVAQPTCLEEAPATGYSALWSIAPQMTAWDVSASGTDPVTGAQTTLHQGVKLLLTAGSCP